MKIIDRYMAVQVIGGTLRGLVWFGGLLLIFALVSAVKQAFDNNLDAATAFAVLIRQLPRIITFTVPMALLFGSVQAFSDLSTRSEILAMAAGSASLPRMLRAPFIWAAFLTVSVFLLQEFVVPVAESSRDAILQKAVLNRAAKVGFRYVDAPRNKPMRRVVQAASINPATFELHQVAIQVYRPDFTLEAQLKANYGVWNPLTGDWLFRDGMLTRLPPGNRSDSMTIKFQQIDGRRVGEGFVPTPTELGGAENTLQDRVAKRQYEMIPITDIVRLRQTLKTPTPELAKSDTYRTLLASTIFGIHDKIATPLVCLGIVLVGCSLGVTPPRARGSYAMGACLLVLMLYYFLYLWARTMGTRGELNPILMAYLAPALTLVLGIIITYRKNV